jgi:hypothetical protein
MQTKSYTADLVPLIKALCGVEFAAIELPRINAMVNRRAQRAYRASNYWTRFLKVGEERTVSNDVVPFTEAGKDAIDTYLRIFKEDPYGTKSVQEFDYMVTASGANIIAGLVHAHLIEVHAAPTQLGVVQADQWAAPRRGGKQLHLAHTVTHLDQLTEADANTGLRGLLMHGA